MNLTKKITAVLASAGIFALVTEHVYAQSNQNLLPKALQDIFDIFGKRGECTGNFLSNRVSLVLFLFLGAVVLIAVFYALQAAIKYIRSEGDPGKIEEAQKAIKAIFFGIAALFIAIVGIVLVFVFFNVNVTSPSLNQLYIQAASSNAAVHCREVGTDDQICKYCVRLYEEVCVASGKGPNPQIADKNGNGYTDDIAAFTGDFAGITSPTNKGANCVDPRNGGVLPDR